jgi:ribosome biogenesis protein Nip4
MIKFIKKFTDEPLIDLSRMIKIDNEFYLVDDKLKKIQKKINKPASFIGVYLGKKDKPSLYLLSLLAKHAENKVWLDIKGAWLFICGRDIFGGSMTKKSGSFNKNDLVLVMNRYDECLGFGRVVNTFSVKKVVVKNEFDIGDFLRREK